MTKFKDFVKEIEEEAKKEGKEAVAHLRSLRSFFREAVNEAQRVAKELLK